MKSFIFKHMEYLSLGICLLFNQNFNIYILETSGFNRRFEKKLINERKEKLTLEFKIRDEVTQEFTQYLAQREADFK